MQSVIHPFTSNIRIDVLQFVLFISCLYMIYMVRWRRARRGNAGEAKPLLGSGSDGWGTAKAAVVQ